MEWNHCCRLASLPVFGESSWFVAAAATAFGKVCWIRESRDGLPLLVNSGLKPNTKMLLVSKVNLRTRWIRMTLGYPQRTWQEPQLKQRRWELAWPRLKNLKVVRGYHPCSSETRWTQGCLASSCCREMLWWNSIPMLQLTWILCLRRPDTASIQDVAEPFPFWRCTVRKQYDFCYKDWGFILEGGELFSNHWKEQWGEAEQFHFSIFYLRYQLIKMEVEEGKKDWPRSHSFNYVLSVLIVWPV